MERTDIDWSATTPKGAGRRAGSNTEMLNGMRCSRTAQVPRAAPMCHRRPAGEDFGSMPVAIALRADDGQMGCRAGAGDRSPSGPRAHTSARPDASPASQPHPCGGPCPGLPRGRAGGCDRRQRAILYPGKGRSAAALPPPRQSRRRSTLTPVPHPAIITVAIDPTALP